MTVIRNLVQRKISNLVAEIKGKYEKGRLMFLIKTLLLQHCVMQ